MKKMLLTVLACIPFAFLSAQNCEADPAFQDSTGVFPMPFDAANPSPDAGINKCAVIDENFEFVFTVGVGDSITIPGSPQAAALNRVEVTEVLNLPSGISYLCEPTDCVFQKSTIGCVKLSGIPVASNAPGAYELEIKVNVFLEGLVFPIPLTFPDENLAPGTYSLQLLADASDPCDVVSTTDQLEDKVQVSIQPNPTSGPVNLAINSDVFGEFDLHVIDLLGQSVHRESINIQQGTNYVTYDGSQLVNGIYFLVLENELGRIAQKMTIQH